VVERSLDRLFAPLTPRRLRVDVVFIDDGMIAELAGRFRGSHRPTDVLTFGYGPEPDGLAGEILISLDTAQRQAKERKVPLERELLLLVVHGLLHLGGQDDETYRGFCQMRKGEFEALMRIL
jgi:probable rRNA maturation factor